MALTVVLGQQQAFGSTGSSFGSETTTVTTANATTVLSVGWWMILNGAHNTVQYTPDAGTTQRTLIAASAGGLVWSDGFNLRILNDATGTTSSFFTQIRGI